MWPSHITERGRRHGRRGAREFRAVLADGSTNLGAMRPTVRLKMTLLYAGVFFVAGALLLSVSYVLVRNNLTNTANLRNVAIDNWQLKEAVQHEVAGDALAKLRVQYGIALAALTGLSVLLGWAVAGRVLRPLQRITATAQRVSQDNLDERIGLEGPRDELKELADTFDGMLERLSGAFASQRRFVANASHELRTPLSVIRTEVDVTLANPDASNAELREMAETVREATLATERLIQALLTLARSEGGIARRDPADLADGARVALAQTDHEAAALGLDVRSDLASAPVLGDRRLLERLVANLVENAIRHNRPGGIVEVRTAEAAGRSVVEVRNDGAVVPADAVASLLEPFERLDRGARGDGAGLGLSIVRSVAEAHGGSVELRARPSGGLVVRVSLPARERAKPDTNFTEGDYADDRARAHA
jgi:signal transduction histidine kinase